VHDLAAARKLPVYAAAIVALALLEGVFRYYMRTILIGLSREVEYDCVTTSSAISRDCPPPITRSNRIGDVMSRATNDLSAVRMVLGPGIMYTANTLATVRPRSC